MRLAVCGRGRWGRVYADTIEALPELTLVGTAGREGWRELVGRPDVDGVVVATAPASHAEISEAALRAGKPVLCEKPLTLDVASARALLEVVRETGGRLLVAHTYLWHPGFQALAQAAAAARPRRLVSESGNHGPHRAEVSALWDYGPHDVAMALAIAGRPDGVDATLDGQAGGESWNIRLAWSDGVEADLHCSNELSQRRRCFTAEFDWGRLEFEDTGLAASLDERPLSRMLRAFAAGATDIDLGVAVVEILAQAELKALSPP
jgi:predicted dehydrogenase